MKLPESIQYYYESKKIIFSHDERSIQFNSILRGLNARSTRNFRRKK